MENENTEVVDKNEDDIDVNDLSDEQLDDMMRASNDEEGDQEENENPEEKKEDTEESQDKSHEDNYKKAMKEERQKRQELQKQLEEEKQKRAEYERWYQENQVAKHQKQNQAPDYDDDPLGRLRWENAQLAQAVVQQNQYLEQQQNQSRFANEHHQLLNNYEQQAQKFAKENEDFGDAYEHFKSVRMRARMAAGKTEEQAHLANIEEELALAREALQQGVNPAEYVYAMAKELGFSPKPKQKGKMDNISSVQSRSKSLSGTGGMAPGRSGAQSIDAIASMSDAEFDKYFAEIEKSARQGY